MHHYLEAICSVDRLAGIETGPERRLGDEPQRIGALLRRAHIRRLLPSVERLGCGGEGLREHGAGFRIQAATHDPTSVLIDPHIELSPIVPEVLPFGVLVPVHATPCAHDLLDVLRRPVQRDLEELRLVHRRRDARERAYLRVEELTATHGIGDHWQRHERTRDAHLLTRRTRGNTGSPAQPVCTAGEAGAPRLEGIELAQLQEEFVGGRMQPGGQLGDLVAEYLGRLRPPLRCASVGLASRIGWRYASHEIDHDSLRSLDPSMYDRTLTVIVSKVVVATTAESCA